MQRGLRPFRQALLGVGMLLLVSGCGGKGGDAEVAVVPAKGRLTLKGQPGANLSLTLVPGGQGSTIRPQAVTGADGSFEVTTYKTGDGGPEGQYKVVVTVAVDPTLSDSKKEEMAGKLAAEAKKVPPAYQKAETTPLSVRLEKGKPDLGTLEIK